MIGAAFADINDLKTYRYAVSQGQSKYNGIDLTDTFGLAGTNFRVQAIEVSQDDPYRRQSWWDPYRNNYNQPQVATAKKVVLTLDYLDWMTARAEEQDEVETDEDDADEESAPKVKRKPAIINTQLLAIDLQTHNQNHNRRFNLNTNYGHEIIVSVNLQGNKVALVTSYNIAEKLWNITVDQNLVARWNNGGHQVIALDEITRLIDNDYTIEGFARLFAVFKNPVVVENLLTAVFANLQGKYPKTNGEGVGKILKIINPIAEKVAAKNPRAYLAYRSLVQRSSRTIDKCKISTLLNKAFGDIVDEASFLKVLEPVCKELAKPKYGYGHPSVDEAMKELVTYKEIRKETLKNSSTRAFNKLMQDVDFLTLDAKAYPLTHAAVMGGEIPVSTFFRKKEQYFLLNDNWDLWEKMLKLHRKETIEIATEASRRTTYEKDLMSYFYFILEELPAYLRQQTGQKWTCSPRLVDSPDELDPPAAENGGVARRRSALTPIVDNEKHTVVVPYASLAMPGRQTTYCYSHNYSILRKGFTFNGNVVIKDNEKALNGRDDYGLMFYTLTGSAQGRGYPTFLIIFEKLKDRTRVHFHRTHPCRSKDGDYNPIHNWVKTAYNWMVGNVHRDRIKAQQGDLVFVTDTTEKREYNEKVTDYDHHRFQKPVMFAKYALKEKSNILGYMSLAEPTILEHNEHEFVMIPAGNYELRQCRSWEANPAGVWSLRID